MLTFAMQAAFLLFSIALLLNVWRLVKGPSTPDRILALDTIYINSLALLLLLGIWHSSTFYFEAALLIAMLGFIGTVVAAKFLLRGDIIE
ncbi:multisubunit potassium/proton antiporter, PhaF subunit [Pseudidiomarina planktonica]|uniref:Multisubunit potassium/proton antiporter, PhaF subunit n=1 Tax=Pseudidiomarina planktonica TaxID=1323738 RepID=A0A1Y6G4U1_9GAMM|nr:K+/H+ antiporter subunit F [Pseudidiomarina planktonica]RUO62849.1 K+/H+ antiporter subunit F [Pseudidiomarina planktonica]SMQ80732.1 multisubunit potassium/proton antiporter, PhaF subunit [Pseudidiomarina planktonica]